MNVLIKQAKIHSPKSKHHGKVMDILVKSGKIAAIKKRITIDQRIKTVTSPDLHCSAGWIDIGAQSGEPGYEHRGTLTTLAQCAKAGGYTHVAVLPNTQPTADTKAALSYITSHPANKLSRLLPIAALSKAAQGQELTEMLDLHEAGAIAYSDGLHNVEKAGLLLRALQYAKRIDGIVIQHAHDNSIKPDGQMHEGPMSTQLGLPGLPAIAEEMAVQRDIQLAQYAEAPLLLHAISTAASCKAIKKAKKSQPIEATVPFINLLESDQALSTFDALYKVQPPLRSADDRTALIKAVKNQVVKAIVSNHQPLDTEHKALEFPYATPGMTGLEVVFASLNDRGVLPLEQLIYALSEGPRDLLGMDMPVIEVGAVADLTLFDPATSWTYSRSHSKSQNTPYLGQTFTGGVIDTVVPS